MIKILKWQWLINKARETSDRPTRHHPTKALKCGYLICERSIYYLWYSITINISQYWETILRIPRVLNLRNLGSINYAERNCFPRQESGACRR